MTDFEKRRDEAAKLSDGLLDTSFIDGADWARKDCAARAEGLVGALKRECCCSGERSYIEPFDFIKCDACEALAAFAKESL